MTLLLTDPFGKLQQTIEPLERVRSALTCPVSQAEQIEPPRRDRPYHHVIRQRQSPDPQAVFLGPRPAQFLLTIDAKLYRCKTILGSTPKQLLIFGGC